MGYDNISMLVGVGVRWARSIRFEAEIKGFVCVKGESSCEKVNVLILQPNILCYTYAILWLLCLRRAGQLKHAGCVWECPRQYN